MFNFFSSDLKHVFIYKAVKELLKKWTHKICGKSMVCFEIKENAFDKRNSVNYL